MAFPFAAVGLGLSALSKGFQLFKGGQQKDRAQRAIDNFQFQDLNNSFEDISVSTRGSDIIREEGQRFTANAIDAARSGGIRGVLSALPRIQTISNDIARDAALNIDDQVREREFLIAQDEARIREINEQRDRDELAGLGRQLAVGQQNFFSGLSGLSNSAFLGARLEETSRPIQQKVATNLMGIARLSPLSALPTADLSGLATLAREKNSLQSYSTISPI